MLLLWSIPVTSTGSKECASMTLLRAGISTYSNLRKFKSKAIYCDMVLQSAGLMPITTIAKEYEKSAKWLNKWLHEHGIQYKLGKVWLLYQKYADRGYVKSKTFTVLDENGDSIAKPNTQWTQRGRMFIYEQLKKEGILPLIEQDDS